MTAIAAYHVSFSTRKNAETVLNRLNARDPLSAVYGYIDHAWVVTTDAPINVIRMACDGLPIYTVEA